MELQPIATVIAALVGGVIAGLISINIQKRKHSDDIDISSLNHALDKQLSEFEQKLIGQNSYLAEKGKNAATKEDIIEITNKIEGIKNDFATSIEVMKLQLSKKANLHKLQAAKEFEVYTLLWNLLTELRLSFEELRPSFDLQPVGTDWNALWNARLREFVSVRNISLKEIEKHKPFYSREMYLELRTLLGVALSEIIDFENSFEPNGSMKSENRERGVENLNKFSGHLDRTCELMRSRITES